MIDPEKQKSVGQEEIPARKFEVEFGHRYEVGLTGAREIE